MLELLTFSFYPARGGSVILTPFLVAYGGAALAVMALESSAKERFFLLVEVVEMD